VLFVGFLALIAAIAPKCALDGDVFLEPLTPFTLRAFGAFYLALPGDAPAGASPGHGPPGRSSGKPSAQMGRGSNTIHRTGERPPGRRGIARPLPVLACLFAFWRNGSLDCWRWPLHFPKGERLLSCLGDWTQEVVSASSQ
jgi:hypothetical protein